MLAIGILQKTERKQGREAGVGGTPVRGRKKKGKIIFRV